jgi:hypothetical protein
MRISRSTPLRVPRCSAAQVLLSGTTASHGSTRRRFTLPAPPFVYKNEAYNSWLTNFNQPYDPYGQGTPAEQAFCNNYR